jgi:hypothetical protein
MESILRTIFNTTKKTAEKAPAICICSSCKKEIDTDDLYLRFTGDLLHPDCLIKYMQKLRILVVVAPQRNGEKTYE